MRRSALTGRRKARALALATLIAIGCPGSPGIEQVSQRIGPDDFGASSPMPRPSVVQLGAEARPVVRAPSRTLVAEDGGALVHDGVARFELTLPAAVRGLGDDAFEILVLPLPFDIPMDRAAIDGFRAKSRFVRRDSGWRMARSEGGRAVVEIEEADAKQLLTRVEAIADAPVRLESGPLELPPGGVLHFGYGSLVARDGATYVFRAALECAGREPRGLFEDTIDGASAARWRDAQIPLSSHERGCRLELEAEQPDGTAVPGAVWAVPRVLAREPVSSDPEPPNFVLISLDTLRADHMSGFGYVRETTPLIDRELIGKGTTFIDATSVFARTDIAHLSLMTATYPSAQPVRGRLAPGSPIVTLAEKLQGEGYETVAFGESGLFGGPYGFWHGFDRFVEFPYDSSERGVGVFEQGAATLRALRDRRFFLTLHTYKTHDPWTFGEETAGLWSDSEPWSSGVLDVRIPEEQRSLVDAYDRTIREADAMVGRFLAALDASGLADRTIVVLVSDHGEAFGEHVVLSHGYGFQQEQLHVPIVFRGPGIPADTRVETPVSLVDVAPTVLDIAGAPPFERGQGLSLVPAFSGEPLPGDRPLFFGWLAPDAEGYRLGSRKIARAPGMSAIFDLAEDPLETARHGANPLPDAELRILDDHLAEAARRRDETASGTARAAQLEPITEEMKRSLGALGYVE